MCAGYLMNAKMLFKVLIVGLNVVSLQKNTFSPFKSPCQRFPEKKKLLSFLSALRVSSTLLEAVLYPSFDHCEFTYCVTGKYILIPKHIMRLDVIPYVRSSLIHLNVVLIHLSQSQTRCIHFYFVTVGLQLYLCLFLKKKKNCSKDNLEVWILLGF